MSADPQVVALVPAWNASAFIRGERPPHRPEFQRVSAYHRAALEAEKHVLARRR